MNARVSTAAVAAFGLLVFVSAPTAQTNDPGCENPVLVSTGGAFPRDPNTLVVRRTGFSNYELAYKGDVLLLDAYFDRGSIFPPLGFKAADIKRVNVILIGHGHVDHMSDAASVGIRTGALVVGAPVTTEKLLTQSINPKQVRTVTGKGGELLKFAHYTIEPILGRHGEPPGDVTAPFNQALRQTTPKPTEAQQAEQAAIRARGTSDPRVIAEGTITYAITLDNGFRIIYRDSGGRITDQEKVAMARTGDVDLALVAVAAEYLAQLTARQALEHVRLYRPEVYMPAHHDAPIGGRRSLWRATEPIFQALKDDNPNLVTVSRGYREPVCFNTDVHGHP